MANLSGLVKFARLQKLLLPKNAAASAAYSCSAIICANQPTMQCSVKPATTQSPQLRPQRLSRALLHSSYYGIRESSSSSNTTAIEDFRSREEQREKEFEKSQVNAQNCTKSEGGSSPEEEAKRAKVEAIRIKILEAALQHVPTLGWSRNAIVQAAEDVGLPSVVHGMFPAGGFDLVSYFNGKCNAQLLQQLKSDTQNGEHSISNPLQFLVKAVRMRLEMIVPYKSNWPQAISLMALPQNASTALAQILTLVDDICYYCGDRSVDIGWYTRRIGLATIMKMTELFMLSDNSPNHEKTWEFLDSRIDEAIQLQSAFSQTDDLTNCLQRSFNSAFITARNILGLDYNRR